MLRTSVPLIDALGAHFDSGDPEMQSITWLDALKLFVPIFGSLVVSMIMLWTNAKYATWREVRNKQEFLRRVIKQSASELLLALNALADIGDKAKTGDVKIRAFGMPTLPTQFAQDLADIDTKHSYIYADYVSCTDICRTGFSMLSQLTKDFATRTDQLNDRLRNAIYQQTRVLRKDLVDLAKSELELCKMISNRSGDKELQDLAVAQDILNRATSELERWPTE